MKTLPPPIKLLVFDLDGTAIPLVESGMPSERVIRAVKEANAVIPVSAATGRSLAKAKPILDALGITGPCIFSGGTQVINVSSAGVLWQQEMEKSTARKVLEVCTGYRCRCFVNHGDRVVIVSEMDKSKPVIIIYCRDMSKSDTGKMVRELVDIPDIAVHFMNAWEKGRFDVHVSHIAATKKHAMTELQTIIGIASHNCMAVGDNNNDLPLFEMAGWKVAMGNATRMLRDRADFVTLPVSHDGLAHAIEKFITLLPVKMRR